MKYSSFTSGVLGAVTFLAAAATPVIAQQTVVQQKVAPQTVAEPAPAPEFLALGHAVMNGSEYTLLATQQRGSVLTGQKVRLVVKEAIPNGMATRSFTLNTGRHKTVAQLEALLAGIFRKFLAGAPAGLDLGKIGDLKYGGEVHFMAESPDILRLDTLDPVKPVSADRFSRKDVQAFVAILAGS